MKALCRLCWRWLKSLVVCPNYRKEPVWKREKEWHDALSPTLKKLALCEEKSRVTLERAEKNYELARKLFESLDGKADSLFRFAGTMAGAVFVVSKAMRLETTPWLILAFLAFIAAIAVCITARRPGSSSVPASTHTIIDRSVKVTAARLLLDIAASFHLCESGILKTTAWKARQVKRASWWFLAGLGLLFAGLLFSQEKPSPNAPPANCRCTTSPSENG